MSSIRNLKKDVNYLAYELLTEAFTFKHFHPEMDEKKFDEVILNLVKLRNELIARINNPETSSDSTQVKAHFRKIQSDMVNLVRIVNKIEK